MQMRENDLGSLGSLDDQLQSVVVLGTFHQSDGAVVHRA
jgi:hypothetical protein